MKKKHKTQKVVVYKVNPAFKDKRGEIIDILEEKVQHVGMVTFSKRGIQRGNHYHQRSIQYSYVLTGKIKLVTSNVDGRNKQQFIQGPGTLSMIPPKVVHTYISMAPSSMLDLTTLSRKANGYEEDTHRIEK